MQRDADNGSIKFAIERQTRCVQPLEFGWDALALSIGQHGGRTVYTYRLAPGGSQHRRQVARAATDVEDTLTFQVLDDFPTRVQENPSVYDIREPQSLRQMLVWVIV